MKTAIQRHAPLLPLYHPLGPLAQSLPKLDPGQFGLPSSLSVDDGDDQAEVDSNAGTARSRRAGPKGREDDAQTNNTPNGVEKAAQDAPSRDRNASPRKRRGGGGAKRKRKDAEDSDGVFPPPAKRTRNPRGAAANSAPAAPSPLVGPAVVASDLAEPVVPESNGPARGEAEEPEEAQEEPAEAQTPKRSARTRKPRAARPAKRRDSSGSASTSTSVSVSIAAATKASAPSKSGAPADDDRNGEADPERMAEEGADASAQKPESNGVEKREEEETEEPPRSPATAPLPAESELPPAEKLPDSAADGLPPDPPQEMGKDVTLNGGTPTPAARTPSPAPLTPLVPLPPAPPVQKEPPPQEPPQKEEREEGELTD